MFSYESLYLFIVIDKDPVYLWRKIKYAPKSCLKTDLQTPLKVEKLSNNSRFMPAKFFHSEHTNSHKHQRHQIFKNETYRTPWTGY